MKKKYHVIASYKSPANRVEVRDNYATLEFISMTLPQSTQRWMVLTQFSGDNYAAMMAYFNRAVETLAGKQGEMYNDMRVGAGEVPYT